MESFQKLYIEAVVRGHQVCADGYRFFANKKLITIFSAPNYCGDEENKAAVMEVSPQFVCRFRTFAPTERTKNMYKRKSFSGA